MASSATGAPMFPEMTDAAAPDGRPRILVVDDHRKLLGIPESIAQLEAGSGTQFDPRIARLFIAAFRESGDPREACGQ